MPLLYSFFLTWFFNHCLESFAFRLKNFLYSCGSAVSELSQILFIWEWLYFTFNLKTISLDIKFLVDSSPHLLALHIMLSRSQGIHSLCFFTLWPHHAACGILAPSAWVLSRCTCVWPCVTLGYSPPGSSVCGILQAPTLEWDAMTSSRESSQPSDQTQVSCIAGRFFIIWATREACEYWSGVAYPFSRGSCQARNWW